MLIETLFIAVASTEINVPTESKKIADNISFESNFIFDYSFIDSLDNESLNRFLLSVYADVDLENVLGIDGAFQIGLASKQGSSNYAFEDLQGFNNIDAHDFAKLYEVIFEFNATPNGLIKLGLQDANNDFAAPEYAGEFINSSMGFSPTIPLPSYPDPTLSIVYLNDVTDRTSLRFGLFDSANSDHAMSEQFFITQLQQQINRSTSMQLGYWYDTVLERGDFYAVLEHEFQGGVYASLQLGRDNKATDSATSHVGMSMNKHAVFSQTDMLGLGYTSVSQSETSEAVMEAYYGLQINEYLNIKLDIQYIRFDAQGQNDVNTLASSVRFAVNFQ